MKAYEKFPLDLLVIFTWVILILVVIITPALGNTSVRTIMVIPMVLFIPGYVLIAVLFPKKDDLEAVERIALSLGLSIAVVPLLGLLLNFSFGIRLFPILITLFLYTIVLLFIAAYRREKLPEDERFSVPFHKIYDIINNEINTPKNRIDWILTLVLISSIVLAAGMMYFAIITPKTGERFTEFYILNTSGKAENYPTNLQYNYPVDLLVGVMNQEYAAVNYTVEVALDREILTYMQLKLDHNETWEKNITFVPNKEGKNMKLEFWLFKDNNLTAPYRTLHLWVNVTK